jgi:hypothetical protein
MPVDTPKGKRVVEIATTGTALGMEGDEVRPGLWESGVYLGRDGFVYHIYADERRGEVETHVAGKRAIGEYLRWVDGLFRAGEIPDESNGIHYRAARKLRELI